MSISIDKLSREQHQTAQAVYTSLGYAAEIKPTDIVIVAQDNDQIVGLVRLEIDMPVCVLRGMQVLPAYQRQGIGTQLLKKLNEVIAGRETWCIPHGWLTGFYGQIGFTQVPEETAPEFLQERIKLARVKWPQVILMKKDGV